MIKPIMKVKEKSVSLKDIAERTGISSMTVSRVVNGSGSVKKDTRVKILAAIKEMGYRKDVFASINAQKRNGIKKKKHVTINFPIAYFSEKEFFNFFSSINMKIISELQAMKLDYSLVHIDDEKDISDIDTILNSDIIINCGMRAQNSYEAIRELNPHAKHICICFYRDNISSVHPDDVAGGKLAAEYFHGLGHENVMCFTTNNDASLCERSLAFSSNMHMLNPNSKVDTLTCSYKNFSDEISYVRSVLDEYFEEHMPSGIFIPNGYDTMIVYKYLKDKCFKIPEDIGILGYDELEFYNFIESPLSRIVFPQNEVGRATVALVRDLLEDRVPAGIKSLIPVNLIDKQSVININSMNPKRKNICV